MKNALDSFKAMALAAILSLAAVSALAESVTLSSTTVGLTNNTSEWWTMSDAVEVASGKVLTFEFDNYSGEANWNNWNLCVANKASAVENTDADRYFVLRSDWYGWGNSDYIASNITTDYAEKAAAAGQEIWAYFKSIMDGAHVKVQVAHLSSGFVSVSATATKGGVSLKETYLQSVGTGDVYAIIVVDHSHIENLTATRADVSTVSSIAVTTNSAVTHYFAPSATTTPVIKAAVSVKANMQDGSVMDVPTASVTFSNVDKTGKFTATYAGKTANGTASVSAASTTLLGSTTEWLGYFGAKTDPVQVKSGDFATCNFQIRSKAEENWHCPLVKLTNGAGDEYGIFRADNYAWLGTDNTSNSDKFGTLDSNWDWNSFKNNLDGSVYTITVTNNGETFDVVMELVDGAGLSHYQKFIGVKATNATQTDADDLYVSVSFDSAYLLFTKNVTSALRPVYNTLDISVAGGSISVSGVDNFDVFDLGGRKVGKSGLKKGLYIVRAGNATERIVIK